MAQRIRKSLAKRRTVLSAGLLVVLKKPILTDYKNLEGKMVPLSGLTPHELEKRKVFVHFPSLVAGNKTALMQEELSPIILRKVHLGLRILIKALNSGISLNDLKDDSSMKHFKLNSYAGEFFDEFSLMRGYGLRLIRDKVASELKIVAQNDLKMIEKIIKKLDLKFPATVSAYKNLKPIEQDIYTMAFKIPSQTACEVQSIDPIKYFKTIEEVADELSNIYNVDEIFSLISPDSEFLHRGLVDVSEDKFDGGEASWKDMLLVVPGAPQNILTQLNKKFKFKKFEIVEPTHDWTDLFLPEPSGAHIDSLITQYKAGTERFKRLTFMFKGEPGTGKTMAANAIAKKLNKSILRVQLGDVERKLLPDMVTFAISRAKAKNAILLFEECEDILWSNYTSNMSSSWTKIIFEQFEGVAVFTSNYSVSDDVLRRMSYVLSFKKPPVKVTADILARMITKGGLELKMSKHELLAMLTKYSVPAGYLEQILQLAAAIVPPGRELTSDILRESIKTIRESHNLEGTSETRNPEISLSEVQLAPAVRTQVESFVTFSKRILSTEKLPFKNSSKAIFYGPSGTGKTMLAEAVANEIGLGFKKTTASDYLSMFVGGSEQKIKQEFKLAEKEKYLLFIDEAEGLIGSREGATRYWEMTQVNEFLRRVEEFNGVLIIATNHRERIDDAMGRRFLYHIKLDRPDFEVRLKIWNNWKSLLHFSEAEFEFLAKNFELTGGEIENVVKKSFSVNGLNFHELVSICERQLTERTGYAKKQMGIG